MTLKKFKVTFLIEGGKDKIIETVEIEASDKTYAEIGAFKSMIYPKYHNKGYRFIVAEVKEI